MNEIKKQIEVLKEMGYYDKARDILLEYKDYDIDISCSSKTLLEYVSIERIIGFMDETDEIKYMGNKLLNFCNYVKNKNIKIEYKSKYNGFDCKLFECEYSTSSKEFIEKWNKEFKKWVINKDGIIEINNIDDLEEFANKLLMVI